MLEGDNQRNGIRAGPGTQCVNEEAGECLLNKPFLKSRHGSWYHKSNPKEITILILVII